MIGGGGAARGRSERRKLRRQVDDLSKQAQTTRDAMFACEASVVEAQARAAGTPMAAEAKALYERLLDDLQRGIDTYVHALALLVDADDKRTSFAFESDEPFHALLVKYRWHGIETVEQAKGELTSEVAHRSVGRTDLAVLLSSIDHTAFNMYETMPEHLAGLHGAELVERIVETLTLEDFASMLVQDTSWAEMRKRWVRLGWRGADEETFNAAFVRAAAERVAEIHDSKSTGGIVDTVLDKVVGRHAPAQRDKFVQAFKLRMEHEYALLARKSGDYGFALQAPRGDAEVAVLRAADKVVIPRSVLPDSGQPDAGASKRPYAYSDHELMFIGRNAWEVSYARGWSDEQVRDEVAAVVSSTQKKTDYQLWPDHLLMFAMKWAVHAFQRLLTSHTFAAALMCSDVQREVLLGIERQWDAFLVIVPNGMLVAGEFEFSRVLVATYSFGAQMILLTTGSAVRSLPHPRTVVADALTLADLLASDEADLVADSPTQRCVVMAKRLVAGLLLNLQHPPNFKVREVDARPRSKGREAEPEHRIVTVGKPLEIDCRAAVMEYIEHGKSGRKHAPPTVQVMVRGHYKRQVCGVGRSDRKVVWIEPYWRGPEAALIQTRAKAYGGEKR